MNDNLISRDLAIKTMMALEEEDIADYGCSIPEGFDGKRAADALRKIPSAEPNIIYCRNCKWSDWYTALNGHRCCFCMETGIGGRTENDYCSFAEREEEEDE